MQIQKIELNKIYKGDAYNLLKFIDTESIDISISSPPYFNQREYTYPEEIGQETTIEQYINHLSIVYSEVMRTLTDRGNLFIVISDVKIDTSLAMVPFKLADALLKKCPGIIFKQIPIWEKPNPPPMNYSSTWVDNYEFVLWFAKGPNYFFNLQHEPYETDITKMSRSIKFGGNKSKFVDLPRYSGKKWKPNPLGRLQRSVWRIAKSSIDTNHPAVYPEELVDKILASACPKMICTKCKRPVYEELEIDNDDNQHAKIIACNCDAHYRRSILLDPFMGSGTSAVCAFKHELDFIGIEYNPNYVHEANRRIKNIKSKI